MSSIAVVGSGIAGLSAAYWLGQLGFETELIERSAKPGLAVHSIDFAEGGNCDTSFAAVDIPLRLLSRNQWPELASLYEEVGEAVTNVDSNQSFVSAAGLYLRTDPSQLMAVNPLAVLNSSTRKILRELRHLSQIVDDELAAGPLSQQMSFEEFLDSKKISQSTRLGFLYPLLSSTIFTCSFDALKKYPASLALGILSKLNVAKHGRQAELLRVKDGIASVAEKLLCGVSKVRLGTTVTRIQQQGDSVVLQCESRGTGEVTSEELTFDHVVVATQANTAAKILATEHSAERTLLGGFTYEDVEVAVHSDDALMPEKRKDWATFNFCLDGEIEDSQRAMCTILLNRFYGIDGAEPSFQTINPLSIPAEERLMYRCVLQRPVVDRDSFGLWDGIEKLHSEPERRVWFVGSYAAAGVPLLESGVVSSKAVVEKIQKFAGRALLF